MPWQWGLSNYLRHPDVWNSCSLEATKYEGKKPQIGPFCHRPQLVTDVFKKTVRQHTSFVGWSFEVRCHTAICCVPLSKRNSHTGLVSFFVKGHQKSNHPFVRNLSIPSLSCISKSSAAGLDNFLMEINSHLTCLAFVMQKQIVKLCTKCVWVTCISPSRIQSLWFGEIKVLRGWLCCSVDDQPLLPVSGSLGPLCLLILAGKAFQEPKLVGTCRYKERTCLHSGC